MARPRVPKTGLHLRAPYEEVAWRNRDRKRRVMSQETLYAMGAQSMDQLSDTSLGCSFYPRKEL